MVVSLTDNSQDNQAKTFETWHGPTGPHCITLVARECGDLWRTRAVDDEG